MGKVAVKTNALAEMLGGIGRTSVEVPSLDQRGIANVIEFVESKTWGLGVPLYPVQRVILKAHYGLPLDETRKDVVITDWRRQNERAFTEADYLRYLFDGGMEGKQPKSNIREVEEGDERRELILSIGRRSGKTLLASCVVAYESYKLISLANPQQFYGTTQSNTVQLISVATGKDQAALLYNEVAGHFGNCGFFDAYIANATGSFAFFQTPFDIGRYGRWAETKPNIKRSIKVTFASSVGRGLRGGNNIVVVLDEVAHFIEKGQSGAKIVYDAITPSTANFSPVDPDDPRVPMGPSEGRIVLISSPLGKQGLFYEQFQIAMGGGLAGSNMLAIEAPTWEVNPTIAASEFEKHYAKDPKVFFTEFGAQFTDRTRGWIDREEDLLACVNPDRKITLAAPPRVPHYLGLDLGLKGDGTAAAIGHLVGDKIVLDWIGQIRADEGQYKGKERLSLEDDVIPWLANLSRKFHIAEGMFDQYTGITFEQMLHKRGFKAFKAEHMTQTLNSKIYQNFKMLMWNQRLELFDEPTADGGHADYITELMRLQAEFKSKYVTVVEAPSGAHDDLSDALVRMVYIASQHAAKGHTVAGLRPGGSMSAEMRKTRAAKTRDYARLGGSHESRQRKKAGSTGSGRGFRGLGHTKGRF